MDRIKTSAVANGRWPEILVAFGVPEKFLTGRHGSCVFCGGRDRARFTNYKDDGWYWCNQCGRLPGIKFLAKFHDWTYGETCRKIDDLLANNRRISMWPAHAPGIVGQQIPKSVRDCALWIQKKYPSKLDAWLDRHDIEVRWWLEANHK